MLRCVNVCVRAHINTFLVVWSFMVKIIPAILKSLTLGRVLPFLNLRELLAFHKDFEEGNLLRK